MPGIYLYDVCSFHNSRHCLMWTQNARKMCSNYLLVHIIRCLNLVQINLFPLTISGVISIDQRLTISVIFIFVLFSNSCETLYLHFAINCTKKLTFVPICYILCKYQSYWTWYFDGKIWQLKSRKLRIEFNGVIMQHHHNAKLCCKTQKLLKTISMIGSPFWS